MIYDDELIFNSKFRYSILLIFGIVFYFLSKHFFILTIEYFPNNIIPSIKEVIIDYYPSIFLVLVFTFSNFYEKFVSLIFVILIDIFSFLNFGKFFYFSYIICKQREFSNDLIQFHLNMSAKFHYRAALFEIFRTSNLNSKARAEECLAELLEIDDPNALMIKALRLLNLMSYEKKIDGYNLIKKLSESDYIPAIILEAILVKNGFSFKAPKDNNLYDEIETEYSNKIISEHRFNDLLEKFLNLEASYRLIKPSKIKINELSYEPNYAVKNYSNNYYNDWEKNYSYFLYLASIQIHISNNFTWYKSYLYKYLLNFLVKQLDSASLEGSLYFSIGLFFEKGYYIRQNLMLSYYWFSEAVIRGDYKSIERRDNLSKIISFHDMNIWKTKKLKKETLRLISKNI